MPNIQHPVRLVQRPIIIGSPPIKIDQSRFWLLFTPSEKAAIDSVRTNPNYNATAKEKIPFFMDTIRSSPAVMLNHPAIVSEIEYLQSVGILSPNRMVQVLNNQLPS